MTEIPSSPLVRTRGLVKRYGPAVALQDVSLDIPEGRTVLLVGPNGAGKSTLLGVLMDLLSFEEGEVTVFGRSPRDEGATIRAGIGFLPENLAFPFDGMRVREVLGFLAQFRPTWDPAYADRLTRELDLRMDRRWRQLSKGETRRAQLVATLAHRPPLLLLDEATDGLDPLARETVLGLLAEHMAETGATTLYSTHVLHEAHGLADHLLVLKGGRVQVQADMETLRQSLFRVHLRAPAAAESDGSESAASGGWPPLSPPPSALVREEARGGGEVRWVMRGKAPELRAWAAGAGAEVLDLRPLTMADAALAYLSPSLAFASPTSASSSAGASSRVSSLPAPHP